MANCVVLLHGLARSAKSMHKMEAALVEQGYDVVNIDYPSRKYSIADLSQLVIPLALKECEGSTVHFVAHSLGGILLRQYLSEHTVPNLGRVVMLGPPNAGSEVVDTLGAVPGFKFINGKAGLELGTGPDSIPRNLGSANFELGVIAGCRSINLILSRIIPGPDDGKVSIENTKLVGMKDHIVMPVSHPFLMKNSAVIQQVIYFLQFGMFHKAQLDE